MDDTKEKEETGQDVQVALEEDHEVGSKADHLDSPHAEPQKEIPNSSVNASAFPETHMEADTASDDKNLDLDAPSSPEKPNNDSSLPVPIDNDKELVGPDEELTSDVKSEANEPLSYLDPNTDQNASRIDAETAEPTIDVKSEGRKIPESESVSLDKTTNGTSDEPPKSPPISYDIKAESESAGKLTDKGNENDITTPPHCGNPNTNNMFLLDDVSGGSESGTEEDQTAFMQELENFFRERSMEFKPPKFYGEGLNCLKLWRAVTRLGGYDKVTSCKLWRQVGESFKPPKTCTTVSWTFRGFYEKALLDYERHKTRGGELTIPIVSHSEPMIIENQGSGSGRARRDAAARAMQGWHSQRLLGNGEVSDPIIKDKNSLSLQKREKQLKNVGLLKRKKPSYMEHAIKGATAKASKSQLDIAVVDIGPPADWVKINVQRTKDCYEVYALVPGLLREEVRVQSDPAGRLVISGEPEHPDNPWGVTPFKKVVSLPTRIDPHQTSAVVTLHGQLFVRVPFEQSE